MISVFLWLFELRKHSVFYNSLPAMNDRLAYEAKLLDFVLNCNDIKQTHSWVIHTSEGFIPAKSLKVYSMISVFLWLLELRKHSVFYNSLPAMNDRLTYEAQTTGLCFKL
jgi:hypothetical protein